MYVAHIEVDKSRFMGSTSQVRRCWCVENTFPWWSANMLHVHLQHTRTPSLTSPCRLSHPDRLLSTIPVQQMKVKGFLNNGNNPEWKWKRFWERLKGCRIQQPHSCSTSTVGRIQMSWSQFNNCWHTQEKKRLPHLNSRRRGKGALTIKSWNQQKLVLN